MKWIKPNGLKIETNDMDETIAYLESLGWEEEGKKSSSKSEQRRNKIQDSASGAVTKELK